MLMNFKHIFLCAMLVLTLLVVFGCTQTQTQNNAPPQTNLEVVVENPSQIPPTDATLGETQTHLIRIDNFSFNPAELTIKQGDKVIWNNTDVAQHTVTSDSGSELNSETLPKSITYEHTFNSVGTYPYHCKFHAGMKAKIIVE